MQTNRRSKIATKGVVFATLVMAVFQWGQQEGTMGLPAAFAQDPPDEAVRVIDYEFFGNTIALAWSPDSRHLAFNAAFESWYYWDYGSSPASSTGVFVVNPVAETVEQIVEENRFHPAWIGNEVVASNCSEYDECTTGLYLTNIDGTNEHPLSDSISHTLAANDHQVLFYSDYPRYTQWNRYDIESGTREEYVSSDSSWDAPEGLSEDQCIQEVGSTRIYFRRPLGLWAQIGDEPPIRLDGTPPWLYDSGYSDPYYYEYEYDYYGTETGGNDDENMVGPCLSPDGQFVAYLAQGLTGIALRVYRLPVVPVVPVDSDPAPEPTPTSAPTEIRSPW